MNTQPRLLLLSTLILLAFTALSQDMKRIDLGMSEVSRAELSGLGEFQIKAVNGQIYKMDVEDLKSNLVGIAHRKLPESGFSASISLPHPDGSMHIYRAQENSTLSPVLAEKHDIRSYDAVNKDGAFVKWDITRHGFHAMIRKTGESTIFIDPLIKGNTEYYIVYSKKDFRTEKMMECLFNSDSDPLDNSSVHPTSGILKTFGTCELRTYRLALTATGEYTAFHGGTVADALSAQITTMNRVNGVFEKDMAITMSIIDNNDLIIYTDAATDPFTNGSPGTMIGQNQSNTDAVIGNSNYDIGHIFGTNSGGLAGLGVVCNNNNKARGVTGGGSPIGDPFDIDYVAHEMGHQFGAAHTFNNSCGGNRSDPTAVEPGSGSTIMAYAGICNPNVQSNSDDHFHGISLQQIGIEILSNGHTCELTEPLANNAPEILSTNGNSVVPGSTPFALTAEALDEDGDELTYNWEQMDNEISTQPPVSTSTGGPNFRSNPSSVFPTRYFPNLQALANGGPFTWEVISSVSREMNFRITLRDNAPGPGSCNDHEDVSVTVDGNSGPFVVTYPTDTGIIWEGTSSETVTWDVAGTAAAPVSCSTVDIFLSTDGGLNYPMVLAEDVPNDGSQLITVPNLATTTARVMVMSTSGTFFNISNNDFEITMAVFDYTINSPTPNVSVCQPDDAEIIIDLGTIGGYDDPVTLSANNVPAGATTSFSPNPVTPGESSILTVSNLGAVSPGSYTLTVQGESTSGTKSTEIQLNVASESPSATSLVLPEDLAIAVDIPTDLTWNTVMEIGVSYDIQISTDELFEDIVEEAENLSTTSYSSSALLNSTTYYWRVRAVTGCDVSPWSTSWSFTTNNCVSYLSEDLGQITNVDSVISVLEVSTEGIVSHVRVSDLDMSHPWVGDIRVKLKSPAGTIITLFDRPGVPDAQWGCEGDDFLLSFDDEAEMTAIDLENMCDAGVPTLFGNFQPLNPLSTYIGEPMEGTWSIIIYDDYLLGDEGILNSWSLELCSAPEDCIFPDIPTVSGANSICEGDSTELTIGNGLLNDATEWNWYSGSCGDNLIGTGNSIMVSPSISTMYYVRGEGGCVVPGACGTFELIVHPEISNSETVNICEGETYTYPDGTIGSVSEMHTSVLTSSQSCDSIIITTLNVFMDQNVEVEASICNGETFVFPDGSSGSSAQTQTSVIEGSGGCDSTIVTTLSVTTVDVSVTAESSSLTANTEDATYQWVDCDDNFAVISGETNATFTPTANEGNYAVIVTQDGCEGMSACYYLGPSSLDDLDAFNIDIYPNPTEDNAYISWKGKILFIETISIDGRVLSNTDVSQLNAIQIDLSSHPSGMYLIHVVSQKDRGVYKLIKQ